MIRYSLHFRPSHTARGLVALARAGVWSSGSPMFSDSEPARLLDGSGRLKAIRLTGGS